MRNMRCALAVASALLLTAGDAAATWSIVAVDSQSREVGIAAASCFPNVDETGGLVPGVGAIAEARDEAVRLLGSGASPRAVLERIATEDFDRRCPVPC
jgi:uncharacterized Ntn-hydrolase superfamily protein